MKKIMMVLVMLVVMVSSAWAECYVQDGTFYSNDRDDVMLLIMYINQQDADAKEKALKMVADGRIHMCRQCFVIVIERRSDKLVQVYNGELGKIWVFEPFLHCQ